ncbi:MAG TPA: hypothetical protein VF995_07775 [Actinomycetota bacterium]
MRPTRPDDQRQPQYHQLTPEAKSRLGRAAAKNQPRRRRRFRPLHTLLIAPLQRLFVLTVRTMWQVARPWLVPLLLLAGGARLLLWYVQHHH